jgi:hypothetical protein
VKEKE